MTEIFLAQFWGLVLTMTGVVLLIRRENLRGLLHLVEDPDIQVLLGSLNIMAGTAQVMVFNTWSHHWTIIITLIGWIILIRGLVILTSPTTITKVLKKIPYKSDKMVIVFVGIIIVGLYLMVKGFGV